MSTEITALHPSLEWTCENSNEGPKDVLVATAKGVLASYKVVKKFFGFQASVRLHTSETWLAIPSGRSLFSAKGCCQIAEHQANGWPSPTCDAIFDSESALVGV